MGVVFFFLFLSGILIGGGGKGLVEFLFVGGGELFIFIVFFWFWV